MPNPMTYPPGLYLGPPVQRAGGGPSGPNTRPLDNTGGGGYQDPRMDGGPVRPGTGGGPPLQDPRYLGPPATSGGPPPTNIGGTGPGGQQYGGAGYGPGGMPLFTAGGGGGIPPAGSYGQGNPNVGPTPPPGYNGAPNTFGAGSTGMGPVGPPGGGPAGQNTRPIDNTGGGGYTTGNIGGIGPAGTPIPEGGFNPMIRGGVRETPGSRPTKPPSSGPPSGIGTGTPYSPPPPPQGPGLTGGAMEPYEQQMLQSLGQGTPIAPSTGLPGGGTYYDAWGTTVSNGAGLLGENPDPAKFEGSQFVPGLGFVGGNFGTGEPNIRPGGFDQQRADQQGRVSRQQPPSPGPTGFAEGIDWGGEGEPWFYRPPSGPAQMVGGDGNPAARDQILKSLGRIHGDPYVTGPAQPGKPGRPDPRIFRPEQGPVGPPPQRPMVNRQGQPIDPRTGRLLQENTKGGGIPQVLGGRPGAAVSQQLALLRSGGRGGGGATQPNGRGRLYLGPPQTR